MVSAIDIPTRATRETATAIEYILINFFIDRVVKTSIFKSGISTYFPIGFVKPLTKTKIEKKTSFIFKRIFKAESINGFKNQNCMKLNGFK